MSSHGKLNLHFGDSEMVMITQDTVILTQLGLPLPHSSLVVYLVYFLHFTMLLIVLTCDMIHKKERSNNSSSTVGRGNYLI